MTTISASRPRDVVTTPSEKPDAALLKKGNDKVANGTGVVKEGWRTKDSFEDACTVSPAVATVGADGTVQGADLVEIKGSSSGGKGTGVRVDGIDCFQPDPNAVIVA